MKPVKKLLNRVALIVTIMAGIATIVQICILSFYEKNKQMDLSGTWIMTFEVEQSELRRYVNSNLKYKYTISFNQRNGTVFGVGEKYWESFDGIEKYYNAKEKTPITLDGKIVKNELIANIHERGKKRETSGIIRVNIESDLNQVVGTFYTTAANSSGTLNLVRKNSLKISSSK